MCGIAGVFSQTVAPEQTVLGMATAIRHRGPDDVGVWADVGAGIAFAHRRLAIVDLSDAGHQPMLSATRRFVLAFNGEVYNHQELRTQLEHAQMAPVWRGHSDTETLLACIEAWGLEKTLRKCVGMFALSLWDSRTSCLSLARDRFGEKPLYYGWVRGAFIFGSELKALRAHPDFAATVSRNALSEYLRFMYIPAPSAIYEGVYKLEPGCLLEVHKRPPLSPPACALSAPASHGSLTISRWWSLASAVDAALQHPFEDEGDALVQLERQLLESVRLQSLADVPLGAFLSGGVDSSLIVALMQRQSPRPVQTFTVGFADEAYDEAPHARAVARHLGTEHHELRVTPEETRSVIPHLPLMYDEPFADSSQIPTHLVCRAARNRVTVALSGDAGDELFGGYNRYVWGPRVWSRISWLPNSARRAVSSSLRYAAAASEHVGVAFRHVHRPAEKMRKLGVAMAGAHSIDDLYMNLVTCWPASRKVLARRVESMSRTAVPTLPSLGLPDPGARMMFWDASTYLPDDILCKVDRAAMAISLETRVPFLDHRVAELAWRLPMHMKIRGGQTKWALREILYRHVPKDLIERPKSGFSLPLATWLRGPLRDWAEHLLDIVRLREQAFFDPEVISRTWQQHLAQSHDWSERLWCVLMFQAWLEDSTSLHGSSAASR